MAEETLRAKIAAACDAVGGVEKKGTNEMQRYKYVKAADIAKSIRHELFKRGIILIADEKEFNPTGEIQTKSGGTLREFTLKVEYTLMDGYSDEKIVSTAFGVAMDSGDKAIYKCKTGALKYFLRGLGLIPDEKDDPEADSDVDDKVKDAVKRFEDGRISPINVREFWKEARKTGHSNDQVAAYLANLGHKQTEEIKQSEYDSAMRWAKIPTPVPQDLAPTLEAAVAMIKAKKVPKEPTAPADKPKRDLAKLFAVASKVGVPESDFRLVAKEVYHAEHLSTDLTDDQYDGLIEWVEGQAAERISK